MRGECGYQFHKKLIFTYEIFEFVDRNKMRFSLHWRWWIISSEYCRCIGREIICHRYAFCECNTICMWRQGFRWHWHESTRVSKLYHESFWWWGIRITLFNFKKNDTTKSSAQCSQQRSFDCHKSRRIFSNSHDWRVRVSELICFVNRW